MQTLATNLPSGFDGAEQTGGYPINYHVRKDATTTIFTKIVEGHELNARLNLCVKEKGAYATLHLDGSLQATLVFADRGRSFCERVTKGALKGLASRVGKRARFRCNKALREEAVDVA